MTLKSKSGFLIHKQIIDPNDPQQRWIPVVWTHDPKRFFTKDLKRVNTASHNLFDSMFESVLQDITFLISRLSFT